MINLGAHVYEYCIISCVMSEIMYCCSVLINNNNLTIWLSFLDMLSFRWWCTAADRAPFLWALIHLQSNKRLMGTKQNSLKVWFQVFSIFKGPNNYLDTLMCRVQSLQDISIWIITSLLFNACCRRLCSELHTFSASYSCNTSQELMFEHFAALDGLIIKPHARGTVSNFRLIVQRYFTTKHFIAPTSEVVNSTPATLTTLVGVMEQPSS